MYHDTTMSLGHTHTHTHRVRLKCACPLLSHCHSSFVSDTNARRFSVSAAHTHTHTNLPLLDEHLAAVLQKQLRVLFYPVNRREEGFHSSSSRQSEDKTSYTGFALISNRRLNILIRSYQPCLHTQAQSRGEIISLLHTPPKLS